jgi:peptide/nickel transport system ATP-binding protein
VTADFKPHDPVIQVRDLQRTYAHGGSAGRGRHIQALKGVSFDVSRGERFGIVGESGSGKSTLIRIIAGLDTPTSGEVLFEGEVVSNLSSRGRAHTRGRLQMIFQDPMSSLDPRMRVSSAIAEPLVAQGQKKNRARVLEMLAAVGLPSEAADRYPHQFSGGQRQRISIARALAPNPQVLLADEPVSALDVSVRAQVLNLLNHLITEMGLTMIFVSHDLGVVRHVCDRVAVLKNGELVELGTTEEVYTNPQHAYTKSLLAAVPTLEYQPNRLATGWDGT